MIKRITGSGEEVLMLLGKYLDDPKAKLKHSKKVKRHPIIVNNIKEVFPFLSIEECRSNNIFIALTKKDEKIELNIYWTNNHGPK